MATVAHQDISFQSVGLNPNPVNTGNNLILAVGINGGNINTWGDHQSKTWANLATLTWGE